MFSSTVDFALSPDDQRTLRPLVRATTLAAGVARRARVILALAEGSYAEIGTAHGVTDAFSARWDRRVA